MLDWDMRKGTGRKILEKVAGHLYRRDLEGS